MVLILLNSVDAWIKRSNNAAVKKKAFWFPRIFYSQELMFRNKWSCTKLYPRKVTYTGLTTKKPKLITSFSCINYLAINIKDTHHLIFFLEFKRLRTFKRPFHKKAGDFNIPQKKLIWARTLKADYETLFIFSTKYLFAILQII